MDNKFSSIFNDKIDISNKIRSLLKIQCNYFLRNLFDTLPKLRLLKIIKYNGGLKETLCLNNIDYKEYYEKKSSIGIQIKLSKVFGKFININEENRKYYHIYFGEPKNEEFELGTIEKINCRKIKIIIDYQINSFIKLFSDLNNLE